MLCLPSRAIYPKANQLGDFWKYDPNFQRCVDAVKMFPAKQHVLPARMVFPVSPAKQYIVKVSCPLAMFRHYYLIAVFGYIRLIDVDVVTVGVACVVVH